MERRDLNAWRKLHSCNLSPSSSPQSLFLIRPMPMLSSRTQVVCAHILKEWSRDCPSLNFGEKNGRREEEEEGGAGERKRGD